MEVQRAFYEAPPEYLGRQVWCVSHLRLPADTKACGVGTATHPLFLLEKAISLWPIVM